MRKFVLIVFLIFTIALSFCNTLSEFLAQDYSLLYGKSKNLDNLLDVRSSMLENLMNDVRKSPNYAVRLKSMRQAIHIVSSMEFHINDQILADKVLPEKDAYDRHYRLLEILDSLNSLPDEQLEKEFPKVGDIRKLVKSGELPRDVFAKKVLARPKRQNERKPVKPTVSKNSIKSDILKRRNVIARDNNIGSAPLGYTIPKKWEEMPVEMRPPLHIVVDRDTTLFDIEPGEPFSLTGLARASSSTETDETMASTFWSESFEGSTFPPSGWSLT